MSETSIVQFPAFIDTHIHCREPGTNPSETIASATRAALLGGFALVVDMPNNPGCPTWTYERAQEKIIIAERDSYTRFAINAGSQPEADNIGELEKMMRIAIGTKIYGGKTTGVDRKTDYEASEFIPALVKLREIAPKKPVFFHAGKDNLSDMIDLAAGFYGLKLHVCHVNDPAQVKLVTKAKREGLSVTCGVCVHHLVKTSHDRRTQGKFVEMQPPLAPQTDAEKLSSQLANGEIDSIESDHAPHPMEDKWKAEESGGDCFGVPGIDHIVEIMLYQAKRGFISMDRLVDALSTKPAQILGVRVASQSQTHTLWELGPGIIESIHDTESGCEWTPYAGMQTGGKLKESRIGGKIVYIASEEPTRFKHKSIKSRGEVV